MANLSSYDTKKLKESFEAAKAIAPFLHLMVFDLYNDEHDITKLSHRIEISPSRSRCACFKLNGATISRSNLQKELDRLLVRKGLK